jgi:hypothetical protein
MKEDGCRENWYEGKNLDDEIKIFRFTKGYEV